MSIRETLGGAESLLQNGAFDGQWGRFDNYISFTKPSDLDEAFVWMNKAALALASGFHGIDLAEWQLGSDGTVETYGKVVELGDRDYLIEIRQLGETSADWLIQQGDEYDGVRDRFDHHINHGTASNLAEAFKAAMDAVENFTPPAPHIL